MSKEEYTLQVDKAITQIVNPERTIVKDENGELWSAIRQSVHVLAGDAERNAAKSRAMRIMDYLILRGAASAYQAGMAADSVANTLERTALVKLIHGLLDRLTPTQLALWCMQNADNDYLPRSELMEYLEQREEK